MAWEATVLTLFPEMFPGPLAQSLAGKALAAGLWRLQTLDIRTFASDKHRSVDDTPFGGGAGMVGASRHGGVGPTVWTPFHRLAAALASERARRAGPDGRPRRCGASAGTATRSAS